MAAPFVRSARGQNLTQVSYQTGWTPEAEHGGLYQALATGIYKEAGLDVDIRKGGPQLNVTALFLANKVDFCEFDSLRMLGLVEESLPGIAVAAFFQKDARVLLSHPGMGNDTIEALKGKPILISTSGRQTYWQWLKLRFGFTDEQIRPYTFNLAPFLSDKQLSMQGLITSEPYDVRQAGVEPVIHLLSDHGYDNYMNVVLAHPKMVQERPDVVQRFVDATAKGWQSYLFGDPTPGNALIEKLNPDVSRGKIAYAIETMKKYSIVESADTKATGLGAMTDERWAHFYESMVAAGTRKPGLDLKRAYTLQFVNRKRT